MLCTRAAPSPNQTSTTNIESGTAMRVDEREDWLNDDQMRLFTERLQPQQWLGPSNMAWVIIPNLVGPS